MTIEYIEKAIADRGWQEGWIKPQPPAVRTGKKVAVIGSGPSGMAAAQQINRAGHTVTVFERDNYIGGLLRLGIPDFKLEKHVVERRVQQMRDEGVVFRTGVYVGRNLAVDVLKSEFDVVLLCIGSTIPRDLPVPGRELKGVHFAMEYLTAAEQAQRRRERGARRAHHGRGQARRHPRRRRHRRRLSRHGAPPGRRDRAPVRDRLPEPPLRAATTTRGRSGRWSCAARRPRRGRRARLQHQRQELRGRDGVLEKLKTVRLEWKQDENGRMQMIEIPGTETDYDADLVLLAMGFLHPEKAGIVEALGVELDPRGNVKTDANKMTSVPGVFAAGDASRGQSLVVWALAEGREAARGVDLYLMGETELPRSLSNA